MKAIIERFIWSGNGGWTVMSIVANDKKSTAVGYISDSVKEGMTVEMTGKWVENPKFGRQFKIDTIVPLMPSTTKGIEKWLASGAIGNVGRVMARRIVAHFGDQTRHVIDNDPERIAEVNGIGRARVAGLIEGLKGNKATRQIIEWLGSQHISMEMINKLI